MDLCEVPRRVAPGPYERPPQHGELVNFGGKFGDFDQAGKEARGPPSAFHI